MYCFRSFSGQSHSSKYKHDMFTNYAHGDNTFNSYQNYSQVPNRLSFTKVNPNARSNSRIPTATVTSGTTMRNTRTIKNAVHEPSAVSYNTNSANKDANVINNSRTMYKHIPIDVVPNRKSNFHVHRKVSIGVSAGVNTDRVSVSDIATQTDLPFRVIAFKLYEELINKNQLDFNTHRDVLCSNVSNSDTSQNNNVIIFPDTLISKDIISVGAALTERGR